MSTALSFTGNFHWHKFQSWQLPIYWQTRLSDEM